MFNYYPRRYNVTSRVKKQQKPQKPQYQELISAELVWGAVVYAYRINGNRILKEDTLSDTGTVITKRNVALVSDQIKAGMPDVTATDLSEGARILNNTKNKILIKALTSNNGLTTFDQRVKEVVETETLVVNTMAMNVGMISFLVNSCYNDEKFEKLTEDITSSPLGGIGTKVEATATVLRVNYSQTYNISFITAKTTSNHLICFPFRQSLTVGKTIKLKGKIKSFSQNTTRLHYTKIYE